MASRRQQVSQLSTDVRDLINTLARFAAVEIMNDLAEAGPEWSGKFKDNWVAVPIGKGASGSTGGGYPYTLKDVPLLSASIKEIARVKKFEIVNISSYAPYALDLEQGVFFTPRENLRPIGRVVETGKRPQGPHFRGDVRGFGSGGNARSTAELDWYSTYASAGKMQQSLSRGVLFGFESKR